MNLIENAHAGDDAIRAEDTDVKDVLTFDDYGLSEKVQAGIKACGLVTPTAIQEQTIPLALKGKDIIGLAQTGSGKTVAFALPTLHNIVGDGSVEALVLTPTRELAHQVAKEFERLGRPMGLNVTAVVGGEPIQRQAELINRGGGVVVATPGRLLDLLSNKRLKRFAPKTFVLDEADEMVDMGFIDSIKDISRYLPKERQTMLFSATMGTKARSLAKSMLNNPEQISTAASARQHEDISQRLYILEEREREAAMLRLLEADPPSKAIIFCRTKRDVDEISERMVKLKIRAKPIHGDMSQGARNAAMRSLNGGQIQLLIATDVASRGLDVSDLSHVFNYHVPFNSDRYTHRIGRTGRAGKKGVAVTFATPRELVDEQMFKEKKLTDFELSSIPKKTDLMARRSTDLVEEIDQQKIKPEAIEACRSNFESEEGFDFMCRMFSMLYEQGEVTGPERIGYGKDEVERIKTELSRRQSRGFGGARGSNAGSSRGGGRPRRKPGRNPGPGRRGPGPRR